MKVKCLTHKGMPVLTSIRKDHECGPGGENGCPCPIPRAHFEFYAEVPEDIRVAAEQEVRDAIKQAQALVGLEASDEDFEEMVGEFTTTAVDEYEMCWN